MARAIMGGLMFSTIVTLFILPTIYVGLDKSEFVGQEGCEEGDGKSCVSEASFLENAIGTNQPHRFLASADLRL